MQTRRARQRRLGEYRLAGRISRGGRQKETEDGVKVEGQSGCGAADGSAGVTLASPGRGQFWRQTSLVWVEVKVEVELKLEAQLVRALSSYSPMCVVGRLANWQIGRSQIDR